ncbi:MAG: murein biosynthesis integral membrane protein MurJ, partial [Chloroflexota bacterium]|nr:murein biosynthesis integral membrane protein MurJ [Chloroflexota bacterium]
SAFIPTFASYLARDDEDEAWRLANTVLTLVGLILATSALLAAAFAPQLASFIVPGFDREAKDLTAQLMRLMLVSPVVFGVSGISMGILNSYQHFLWPAWAASFYNLAIIGGAVILAPSLGVYGLAVGVVVGSFLHLGVQMPALLAHGWRYRPLLDLGHPGVQEVGRLMLPRMLGLAAVHLNFIVNTILASGLGEGAIAALDFAWKMTLLPEGILAMAVATAAFPTFSALAAQRRTTEMREAFTSTLRGILYLTIPAGVGLFVLRYPLIQLLFQRGAFDLGSTRAVAWALQFYAPGLFTYSSVEIATRAFYAFHDTRTPVLISLMTIGLNIALSLIFIRFSTLAHGGLALSSVIATTSEMAALLILLRRHLGGLRWRRLLFPLLRMAVAAGLMGLIVGRFAHRLSHANLAIVVAGGIALGAFTYLAISLALGSRELRGLWLSVRPRRGDRPVAPT